MVTRSTRRPATLAAVLTALAVACGGGGTSSSGTAPLAKYVATTGSDEADGSAQHPYRTIARAIASVKSSLPEGSSGEVRVAAGTYPIVEPITLVEGVSLRGGYSTTSWSDRGYRTKEDRANTRYRTLIVPSATGAAPDAPTVLGSGSSLTRATVIEGFTIVGGRRAESSVARYGSAVVSIADGAGVSLRNNTIRDTAGGGGEVDPQVVDAWILRLVDVVSQGSALVASNTLEIGSWSAARTTVDVAVYGIRLADGAHTVDGNEILGGEIRWAGTGYSSGVAVWYGEHRVSNNTIRLGRVSAEYAAANGISTSVTSTTLDGNLILGGVASGSEGGQWSGIVHVGIPGGMDETAIYFNTVVMGELDTPSLPSSNRGGIGVQQFARARIASNIVYSPRGLGSGACIWTIDSIVAVRSNDLFGCDVVMSSDDTTEVRSVEELNALTTLEADGNLGVDPLFVNTLIDDYHLSTRSPENLAVRGGALDLGIPTDRDGRPRTTSTPSGTGLSGISLGAYEAD
jgi:hypothetical protein